MATRKKKTEKIIAEVSKLVAEETLQETETPNVATNGWPKIKQGSHLLVRTYKDGRTELEWDDEALLRDVRAALNSVKDK